MSHKRRPLPQHVTQGAWQAVSVQVFGLVNEKNTFHGGDNTSTKQSNNQRPKQQKKTQGSQVFRFEEYVNDV